MAYCLTDRADAPPAHRDQIWAKRFAAARWTVNFPRPMMASVISIPGVAGAPDAQNYGGLRIDVAFYRKQDLCGLIWTSVDTLSHPLRAYATARDYRRTQLSFRWRSAGIKPLDAVHGPTLTIEGRDAAGAPRAWYVRLWNYAVGTAEDAVITLNFDALAGGFLHPAEADPLWAGDIDRMFISLVPPGFDATNGDLPAMAAGWAEMSALRCDGSGSMVRAGDAMIPAHGLSVATGYDDSYNQTPEALIDQIVALGYRGDMTHYVGMSHYFVLEKIGPAWLVKTTGGVINPPCAAWHADFARRAKAAGLGINWSLSYELFDAHTPDAWKQRAADGAPAQTGWVPPSTLLSPANTAAMAYLQSVARGFVSIAKTAALPVRFQIGEPWYWIMPDGRPCLYDAATTTALGAASVAIPTVRSNSLSAAQKSMLDAAGAVLAGSTLALATAVRAEAALAPNPGAATMLLLAYLPGSFDSAAPDLRRANCPLGWAHPAYDVLQTEDYEWVTAGRLGDSARAQTEIAARLNYPLGKQHYMAGFVLNPAEKAQWRAIDAAADAARVRGAAATILWAFPQICRDGFVRFGPEILEQEDDVTPIDDVLFPIDIGREAQVITEFSTQIAASPSGHEARITAWANARMAYDAGPGVRSDTDVATLMGFFRNRRGQARGFRFRDPFDASSATSSMAGSAAPTPTPTDMPLGIGNGTVTRFALVKSYGVGADAQLRRITRPVSGSVRIAVNGAEVTSGWTLGPLGQIDFATAPAAGAVLTAGYRFDVPVRFASDTLDVSRATFAAGDIASVPLIEIREGV